MTLDDWTKLLDVALEDTQNTCVTLTEVPDTTLDLRSVIMVARSKAESAGMFLSRLELPSERYDEAADFPGAVGADIGVVRLTFSALAPVAHGRRIVVNKRDTPQPQAKPAVGRARGHHRRTISLHRGREPARTSDLRQT